MRFTPEDVIYWAALAIVVGMVGYLVWVTYTMAAQ